MMTSTAKTDITYDKSTIKTGQGGVVAALQTALDDIRDHVRSGLVGVSADATHIGTLEDVLLAGAGVSMSTQNSGGNETRTISQSGATGIDVSATAGEALSIHDMVYLNESDGKWYQQDSDATSPVKMGRIRGCVTAADGIAQDETGAVRILGPVTGFVGLTAGEKVYASSTAGAYTQTKPIASSSPIAMSEMGYAISTTTMWIEPKDVTYRKQTDVSNGGTLSIEHHADNQTYEREISVRLVDITPGSSQESHGTGNHEAHYPLQGPNGAGTTSILRTATSGNSIGNQGGTVYIRAQKISGTGVLHKFDVHLGGFSGSPTGTITWEIQTDDSDDPSGTVVSSGEFTPTASATNSVSVTDSPHMANDHWLVLKSTDAQSSGSYFTWLTATTGSDAHTSVDDGASWTSHSYGMVSQFYCLDTETASQLAQSFQPSSGVNVGTIRLYLAKFGNPSGDLTASIYSSNGNPVSAITNGISNAVAAADVGTSFDWVDFTFDTAPSLTGSTTYWIVLQTTGSQDDDHYVSWAIEHDSPSYANGQMKQYEGSWAVNVMADAIFDVLDESEIYYSQALLDDWDSALATILARFDDGSGSNPTTQTTIKNNTGSEKTLELAVTF